jgi:hypothetical protein
MMIEWLRPKDSFRVITKEGSFQMTKEEFYCDFANVVKSASYQDQNLYHYSKLPPKAGKYKIA